jgi:hypothetical protein
MNISSEVIDLLVPEQDGQYSVWPHPLDIHYKPMIPQDVCAEGAEYCIQYEEELARLEILVKEFWIVGPTSN